MRFKLSKHRAVDPVIATLLLVAIAVVGGTIIFVFSQEFFKTSQISGTPTVEAVRILGYDARDADALIAHDGVVMPSGTGGVSDGVKMLDERVAVYVTNNSAQKITIADLLFAGKNYTANSVATTLDGYNGISPAIGEYVILTEGAGGILQNSGIVIQAGQTVTIVLDLEDSMKIGRDTQFQLKTTRGNLWLTTVNIGQNSG
jgi:archaeal type IV pilus assembly protein PilA